MVILYNYSPLVEAGMNILAPKRDNAVSGEIRILQAWPLNTSSDVTASQTSNRVKTNHVDGDTSKTSAILWFEAVYFPLLIQL